MDLLFPSNYMPRKYFYYSFREIFKEISSRLGELTKDTEKGYHKIICLPVIFLTVGPKIGNSMDTKEQQVWNILNTLEDPLTKLSFGSLLKESDFDRIREKIVLSLKLSYPADTLIPEIQTRIQKALANNGVSGVTVNIKWQVFPSAVRLGLERINEVRNVIAIASGKGGVGKSTTTVNLASSLALEGARVGILDGDIYGPSIPAMLGVPKHSTSYENKLMEPVIAQGLQTNSIGFLIGTERPAIWRGPMIAQAIEQLLKQTNWKDLDYLLIDMPPGTGDIALTLAQRAPMVGVLIVTTPQDIALLDVRKAINMFRNVNVLPLGVLENMSVHVCPHCGHTQHLFGKEGGRTVSEQYKIPYLGAVPIDLKIRENTDNGSPIILSDTECKTSKIYRNAALQLAAKLSLLPRDDSKKFPTMKIKPA